MNYEIQPEIILFGLNDVPEPSIPEVKLTFSSNDPPLKQVTSISNAADIIRSLYEPGTIELQEQVIVLYLNAINKIKGFYRHSIGSVNATMADFRLILTGAMKSLSISMIIAHNHPSGTLAASDPDIELTKKLIKACKLIDVRLIDHIILAKNGYYSMLENKFPGLAGFDLWVMRRHLTTFGQWERITMDQAVKELEGYWKPETIRPMLEEGQNLHTPFAEYRVDKYEAESSKDLAWLRARLKLMEELRTSYPSDKKEKGNPGWLLRYGLITERIWKEKGFENEKQLVDNRLSKEPFSNAPLRFSEVARFNTWFKLYPEKIAGKEVFTTSMYFPVTIKGTKEDILKALGKEQMKKDTKNLELARAKAKAMKMKLDLLNLDGFIEESWYDGFSGLDGSDAIETLGSLGNVTSGNISSNVDIVRNILHKQNKKRKFSSSDTLSFEEIMKLYNNGISEDEIKAWVWYKRTLGVPMKGWDKYFLPNTGIEHDQVFTIRETMIKDNHFRDLHTISTGVLLGKPTRFKNEYAGANYLVITGTDNNKYYVIERDIEIRKASFKTDPKILDELVKREVLFYLNGDLLPSPIYVLGNMYDRQLALDNDKEAIVKKYGEQIYNAHKELIEKAKPKLISITNPDPKERPQILCISEFARNISIKDLKVETGIDLVTLSSEPVNLVDAFKIWLKSLDATTFKESAPHDIIHYYIEGHNLSKKLSDAEKEQIEKFAPIEGEELFSKFLYEALLFEDQQKIDFKWNREYNGQSSVQHHKIPVGFKCSAMFKKSVLEFTPAQREAIAFMEAVGSGIIAYDVGVGKTMSAIITLANAMYQGKCKSPLIVVPNPTYEKWVREIIGYTDEKTNEFIPGVLSNTGIQVNGWYNLGTNVLKKINFNKKIPPNTITVITYEGFVKIGFSNKVMNHLFEHLADILAQREDYTKSTRDLEKKRQKYREIIGTGMKNTITDIDTLGIDYIVIDEAHNFKNVFADVKSGKEGIKRFKIQSGESERAIKAFFLCNYIQRTFKQNVMLLTATPFTNSPLEIYSMLSHVGYESLKNMGIENIQRFMETFIKQTIEYAPNYKDEIAATPVVKSFNNRLVLQKLLYNSINYKTGEEAGVRRPCKINLPRINSLQPDGTIRRLAPENQILTYLAMSSLQRMNQSEIVDLARAGTAYDSKIMVALGQSLDNALSPFLYKHTSEPEDYLEFVEESPKIKYALECIRSVKEYHEKRNEPVSGQIIYANRGKDYFHFIKEYLEKEIGFKANVKSGKLTFDEVEIVSSAISQDQKEAIKDAFLEGVVKVIIGTSTIREGIDLQNKCGNIYNLYPDWNPTDVKQLEGRGWRPGNEFGYIRVTMPLVENSMDVFIFQKLDEKMHRINDIWYKGDRGNVMDLDSLDPEEVKFALFTNIDALATLQRRKHLKDMDRRLTIVTAQIDTLKRLDFKIRKYFEYQAKCIDRLLDIAGKYKTYFFGEGRNYEQADWWMRMSENERKEIFDNVKIAIEEVETFLSNSSQDDKELLRVGRQLYKVIKETGMKDAREDVFSEFKAYLSEVRKAEKTILEQKGYTIHDNFTEIISSFEKEKAEIEEEENKINSEEYYKELYDEVVRKKEKLAIQGKTIEERVTDFASLNYLLDYKFSDTDTDNCMIPDRVKKFEVKQEAIEKPRADKNRERMIRLARAKAVAMKMQLELLEND